MKFKVHKKEKDTVSSVLFLLINNLHRKKSCNIYKHICKNVTTWFENLIVYIFFIHSLLLNGTTLICVLSKISKTVENLKEPSCTGRFKQSTLRSSQKDK